MNINEAKQIRLVEYLADNRTFSGQCAWLPVLVPLPIARGTYPLVQGQR